MGPRSDKLVFNSVLNFRRVTQFRLCLLDMQVPPDDQLKRCVDEKFSK